MCLRDTSNNVRLENVRRGVRLGYCLGKEDTIESPDEGGLSVEYAHQCRDAHSDRRVMLGRGILAAEPLVTLGDSDTGMSVFSGEVYDNCKR